MIGSEGGWVWDVANVVAIPIFVNLNIPRYIKHELCNMIKTCIVIRLTTFISIHGNPLHTYIQLKLHCKRVWR